MFIRKKGNKWQCCVVAVVMLLTAAFTLPLATGMADEVYADTDGDYTYTVSGEKATITGYHGPGGDITIPLKMEDYPVTAIGANAFQSCSSLTGVTIPAGVSSIGAWAFFNCSNLTGIIFPNSVTSIGEYSFCFNSATDITIPAGVSSIGYMAFAYSSKLTEFNVDPDNEVYSSEDGVLFNKSKDTLIMHPGGKTGHYTIPTGVISIGAFAFAYCNNLTGITIPTSVTSIGEQAFYGCNVLAGIAIPASVTSIGLLAFSGCERLIEIDVDPNNEIYYSENEVLFNKSKTTLISYPGGITGSYIIPDGVTSIEAAFWNCYRLSGVTVPDSVTSIGNQAFGSCSSLTEIVIPDSVISIGDEAFRYSGLTDITIPDSVASIGEYAFGSCSSLTDAIIPGSVTSFGRSVFSSCNSLTNVIIQNGVIEIGENAFDGCESLTSIAIPDSVASIGAYAFNSCYSLTGIIIPDSVISIGSWAFYHCQNLRLKVYRNSYAHGYAEDNEIPYDLIGESTITIFTVTFDANGGSVSPDTITAISGSAIGDLPVPDDRYGYIFKGWFTAASEGEQVSETTSVVANITYYAQWETLTDDYYEYEVSGENATITGYNGPGGDISIPSKIEGYTVTAIGENAFRSCSSLTGVTIPDGVTSIGENAFIDCGGLTGITIPDSVTLIGEGAFYGCSSLPDITIPAGVTSIGTWAFSYCRSLTEINVDPGNEVYYSENGVLFNKSKTTLIAYPGGKTIPYVIPDSVTSIGNVAFAYCRLTGITIPNSVTSIGNSAFLSSSLTSIFIPNSVTSIDRHAFENCRSLTEIKVDSANTVYSSENGVLFNKSKTILIAYPGDKTASYTIPSSVTSIRDYAFYYCSNLTDIIIPSGVTSLGEGGFYGCSRLAGVTIPASVTNIVDSAFIGCSPNLRFKVYPGSYALKYAYDHGILYDLIIVEPTSFTVTFDANYGSVSPNTKTVAEGAAVGDLPEPTRPGYMFKGWFTALSGGEQVSAATPVTANVTYYAVWEEVVTAPPVIPPVSQITNTLNASAGNVSPEAGIKTVAVTLNASGGNVSPGSKTVTVDAQVGSLPIPKRTGYDFKGWYTAKSGGVKVSANTTVNSDTTFYAQWKVKSYKATFNANKGKISGKAKLVKNIKYNSKLGKLNTPKRTGYKFKGWYTKKSGGKKIKTTTKMPAKNMTYYAHWKKD